MGFKDGEIRNLKIDSIDQVKDGFWLDHTYGLVGEESGTAMYWIPPSSLRTVYRDFRGDGND